MRLAAGDPAWCGGDRPAAPGKVTRTRKIGARRTGRARVAPGKVTLTSYLGPRGPRAGREPEASARERLRAQAWVFEAAGLPLPDELQSALARHDGQAAAPQVRRALEQPSYVAATPDVWWPAAGWSRDDWMAAAMRVVPEPAREASPARASGKAAHSRRPAARHAVRSSGRAAAAVVQRKPRPGAADDVRDTLEELDELHTLLQDPPAGKPVPAAVQREVEAVAGQPLDHVRVHDDARSARLAQQLGARAFTVGSDVFFAAGEYDPDSSEGRRLLAHELTHAWQNAGQRPARDQPLRVDPPSSHAERQADAVAEQVVARQDAEGGLRQDHARRGAATTPAGTRGAAQLIRRTPALDAAFSNLSVQLPDTERNNDLAEILPAVGYILSAVNGVPARPTPEDRLHPAHYQGATRDQNLWAALWDFYKGLWESSSTAQRNSWLDLGEERLQPLLDYFDSLRGRISEQRHAELRSLIASDIELQIQRARALPELTPWVDPGEEPGQQGEGAGETPRGEGFPGDAEIERNMREDVRMQQRPDVQHLHINMPGLIGGMGYQAPRMRALYAELERGRDTMVRGAWDALQEQPDDPERQRAYREAMDRFEATIGARVREAVRSYWQIRPEALRDDIAAARGRFPADDGRIEMSDWQDYKGTLRLLHLRATTLQSQVGSLDQSSLDARGRRQLQLQQLTQTLARVHRVIAPRIAPGNARNIRRWLDTASELSREITEALSGFEDQIAAYNEERQQAADTVMDREQVPLLTSVTRRRAVVTHGGYRTHFQTHSDSRMAYFGEAYHGGRPRRIEQREGVDEGTPVGRARHVHGLLREAGKPSPRPRSWRPSPRARARSRPSRASTGCASPGASSSSRASRSSISCVTSRRPGPPCSPATSSSTGSPSPSPGARPRPIAGVANARCRAKIAAAPTPRPAGSTSCWSTITRATSGWPATRPCTSSRAIRATSPCSWPRATTRASRWHRWSAPSSPTVCPCASSRCASGARDRPCP